MHWTIFAGLAVIGFVTYNILVRVAGESMNAFAFGAIMSTVAVVFHGIAWYIYSVYTAGGGTLNKTGVTLAVFTGIAIFVIDMAFFFMLQKDGGLSISVPTVTVLVTFFTAIIGILYFGENFSLQTGLALIMIIGAIWLLK